MSFEFTRKCGRGAGHTFMFLLEWVAGFVGIALVLTGLLLARLAYGPMSTDLMTPYLESALSSKGAQLKADVMHSTLSWDRFSREFGLELAGITLNNTKGEAVINVPAVSLRLDALTLLIGRVTFESVRINGVNIKLERTADGHLTFPGVEPQQELSPVPPPSLAATIGDWPRRLAELNYVLSRLQSLSVTAVQVTLTDHAKSEVPQTLTLPDLVLKEIDGRVQGSAEIKLAVDPAPLALKAEVDMSPTDGSGAVKLSWEKIDLSTLTGIAPGLAGLVGVKLPLTGEIAVRYAGGTGKSHMQMMLTLETGAGSVQLPGLWPEAVPVKNATLIMTADATPKGGIMGASLDKLAIDLDGPTITAGGKVGIVNKSTRSITAEAEVKGLPVDRLASVWPPAASSGARDWVTTHLSGGSADGTLKMEGEFGWPKLDDFKIGTLGGTITMAGVKVDYLPDLPPITNAGANATYDRETMRIAITGGDVNGVAVQPSETLINLLPNPIESIAIKAHGIGKVGKILEIIDRKPLEYAKRIGLTPADMEGDADFLLNIDFPLLADLPLDKINVGLESTIRNFTSDKLIGGLNLTGGTLKAVMDTTNMKITGTVNANGVPTDVDWKEVFVPAAGAPASDVLASVKFDNAALEKFGVIKAVNGVLYKYIDTAVPVKINYQRFGDKAGDTVQVDADLTPTALDIKPLGFVKKAGEKGNLTAKLKLPWSAARAQAQVQVTSFNAAAAGLNLAGTAVLDKEKLNVQQLVITKGKFGASNVTANLKRMNGDGWQGTIAGPVLDLGALRDKDNKDNTPLPPLDLNIHIDRAVFGPDRSVAPLHVLAKRSTIGWQALDVEMNANGTPFTAQLKPKSASDINGPQSLHIETPNLGNVLRATDLTDTVLDGTLVIDGDSDGPDKPITAKVMMNEYRLQGMPFVASLVSAISAEGLLNELFGQKGLYFNRLRGTVIYTPADAATKTDEIIKIKNAKTSGGALGLTIEGTANMTKSTVDLNGTAVPFNSVNSILGNVPLIGEVLGGNSGVFAATYRATGPFQDIKVSVNPLSILAPGFLRGLFFGE